MSAAGELDIQGVIAAALAEFFERILSMKVELDEGDLLAVQEGEGFIAVVEVTGGLAGRLEIKVGSEFAVLMAASMLGGNIEDVDAEYEVPDLLGEMADFLGRKLKEICSREGVDCDVAATQIIVKDDMLESSAPLKRGSRYMFRQGDQEGWVDFRLAPGEEGEVLPAGGSQHTDTREPEPSGANAAEHGEKATEELQTTVAVSDGNQALDLELEPLGGDGDEGPGQDVVGFSEEEDPSDLMADIPDTGEGAGDGVGGRAQAPGENAPAEGDAPVGEAELPADDPPEPPGSQGDDFEGLSDDEEDILTFPDEPAEDLATESAAGGKVTPAESGPPGPRRITGQEQAAQGDPEEGRERGFRLEKDAAGSAAESLPRPEEEVPEDEEETASGRGRGLFWLTAAMLAAVAVGGWFFMMHRTGVTTPEAVKTAAEHKGSPAPPMAKTFPAKVEPEPSRKTAPPTIETRLAVKLDQAANLREALVGKLEEVLRLKRYFQDGVEDIRSQVAVRIQNSGVRSYRKAMQDRRIELDLRTIQRRLAAIDELSRPIGWLAYAAEAVDYGIRRTRIDMVMAPYTAGADLKRLYQELENLTTQYALRNERLLIDGQTVEARPLTVLWQEINSPVKKASLVRGERLKGTFVNWAGSAADRRIWKEICRGDFSHASELTMISAEAAACLASDQVKDLFLSSLRELPGAAARNLVKWPGKWLVLNGITTISPAAARQLSRWRGTRLSLNGLVELSPQAAVSLASWGGRDLEMVNLSVKDGRTARQVLEPLKKWEGRGRRLFVPPAVRRMLDSL